jgi:hypothetical protein
LEELNVGASNIKINIIELGCESFAWIQLAQVEEQQRALVNTALNFLVV